MSEQKNKLYSRRFVNSRVAGDNSESEPTVFSRVNQCRTNGSQLESAPAKLTEEDLTELKGTYGKPILYNERGNPSSLNERYWAAVFARTKRTIYEPDENRIYTYEPERGLFLARDIPGLREEIARLLHRLSAEGFNATIRRFINIRNLNNVVAALQGISSEQGAFSRISEELRFIHAANCMLVFNGLGFYPERFSPSFRSRCQSPIPYYPGEDCPKFRQLLDDAYLDEDDQRLIQAYFGQCLLGRNLSQTMLLLDGEAGSSKTTIAKVIGGTVGEYNCAQLRTGQLHNRFEFSAFIGKSLLMAPDVKANFLQEYGAPLIKVLTGGDRLDAEMKGSNQRIPLEGLLNLIITANSRLRAKLEGDASAWFRRLLRIWLGQKSKAQPIADYDRLLIAEEGCGLLNFGLAGAQLLLGDLAETGVIKLTTAQRLRISRFIDESDSLRVFLRDQLAATTNSQHDVTNQEIIDRYSKDCVQHDITPLPIREIENTLSGLMFELFGRSLSHSIKRDDKGQRGYSRIKWVE